MKLSTEDNVGRNASWFRALAWRLRNWLDDFLAEDFAAQERKRRSEAPGSADDFTQPDASVKSAGTDGPPAFWLERVKPTPPEHWLERVREAAPQLLTPPEQGGISTQAAVPQEATEAALRNENLSSSPSVEVQQEPRPAPIFKKTESIRTETVQVVQHKTSLKGDGGNPDLSSQFSVLRGKLKKQAEKNWFERIRAKVGTKVKAFSPKLKIVHRGTEQSLPQTDSLPPRDHESLFDTQPRRTASLQSNATDHAQPPNTWAKRRMTHITQVEGRSHGLRKSDIRTSHLFSDQPSERPTYRAAENPRNTVSSVAAIREATISGVENVRHAAAVLFPTPVPRKPESRNWPAWEVSSKAEEVEFSPWPAYQRTESSHGQVVESSRTSVRASSLFPSTSQVVKAPSASSQKVSAESSWPDLPEDTTYSTERAPVSHHWDRIHALNLEQRGES
jgi:hypothetical protein